MAAALTAPFAVAALVLCAAGTAKLRSPGGAVSALIVAGLPAPAAAVRVLAMCEILLGVWALMLPTRANAAAVAALYVTFCAFTLLLARRRAGCGCFGESTAPASAVQALLSGTIALVAVGAALSGAHGLGWVLDKPVVQAAVLLAGVAAAAYGTVIAYTRLPEAWSAWSVP